MDPKSVQGVCELIRSWPTLPLTWDLITGSVALRGIGGWTRQALAGNERILEAYRQRKVALAKGKTKTSRDPAVVVLKRQVEDLQARLADVQGKLAAYEERFLIMIRNAAVKGVSPDELERPLLPIDRKAI